MRRKVAQKMAQNDVYLVVDPLMSTSNPPDNFTPDQREKLGLAKSGFETLVDLAKEYGLKVAFGSDVFLSQDAYDLQALEWIARAPYFTPNENLRTATWIGGEIPALSGPRNRFRERPLGVIREGIYATYYRSMANCLFISGSSWICYVLLEMRESTDNES